LTPVLVHGLGIRIPDQDAEATARGNAFVATADNPGAIYYNPAGITQLDGQQVRVGTYAVWLNSHYTAAGAAFNTKDQLQAVPQVYYTYSPESLPLSFGLGFYSPYGLSLEWPDKVPFRSVGTRGEVTYLTFNPVVAWRVNSQLSLAAGPTANYSQADLRQGIVPFNLGDQYRFKGDDTDVGYNLGLRWQPHPKVAFGITYRSETTLNYQGHSQTGGADVFGVPSGSRPASARFAFPQNVVAGISFRPTPAWNVEFDVDWTDWNRLKTVTVNQLPLPPAAKVFNWRSSFMYEWGVTRSFENGFNVSAGYMFSENSVPDQNFTPLVPDSDRHIFSVGVGRNYRHLRWEVGYQFAYGPPRTMNDLPAALHPANGTYRFLSHALAASVGYSF
jgi:long-chain fatty acid transport protein